MKIDQSEVEHVGKLARLHVSDEEKQVFSHQLSKILAYIDELNKIETEGIEQVMPGSDVSTVLRDDMPTPSLSVEEALANAPYPIDGCFGVPRIITDRS